MQALNPRSFVSSTIIDLGCSSLKWAKLDPDLIEGSFKAGYFKHQMYEEEIAFDPQVWFDRLGFLLDLMKNKGDFKRPLLDCLLPDYFFEWNPIRPKKNLLNQINQIFAARNLEIHFLGSSLLAQISLLAQKFPRQSFLFVGLGHQGLKLCQIQNSEIKEIEFHPICLKEYQELVFLPEPGPQQYTKGFVKNRDFLHSLIIQCRRFLQIHTQINEIVLGEGGFSLPCFPEFLHNSLELEINSFENRIAAPEALKPEQNGTYSPLFAHILHESAH